MRKAFAIWLMAGLPVLADSVAATRSWVSNRVAEARSEWRGEVVAATNPVPSWISAAEGRVDVKIGLATNGLPERIASVTNGLPERIASVTNGLPAKMAALTNGLPEAIAGSTNGLPERIASVTNGLPERIAAVTNGLPERIAVVTNGLPERMAALTNGLPERIAAVTNGLPESVVAATNGVMEEVNAATGSLWRAIGNIEGVTADIGELARTNDLPTKVSQLENDAGYLTNHVDVSNLAQAAGLFPDWTSKGTWSEGEFCTWKGVVYRFTGAGDPSAQPDISPASWAVSDVGTAISEARPDMSSLTNPIPSWIAASTNGLPEAIAAATNGLPAKIAAVTNGLPERLAAVTNGLPEQIAASTNGIPEAIAASTNALAGSLPRLVADATSQLDLGDAFRLYKDVEKRSYIDGDGAIWNVYGAPHLVTGDVVVVSLTSDTWFPTPAESVRLDEWGGMANPREWTNSQWTVTWGEESADMADGVSVTPEPGDTRRLLATKRFTLNDVEPNPSYQSSGYTAYLDGYARELWRHDIQVSMLYSSTILTNGLATVALEFSDVRVAGGFDGQYSSCTPIVEWDFNGDSVVITYGVDFVGVSSGGYGNIWQYVSVTRTIPRYLTFRPGTRTVQTGRLANVAEMAVADAAAVENGFTSKLPLMASERRFGEVFLSADWQGISDWPADDDDPHPIHGSLSFYSMSADYPDVVIVTNGLGKGLHLYPYSTNAFHILPYGQGELAASETWRAEGSHSGYAEITAETDLVAGGFNPYATKDALDSALPRKVSDLTNDAGYVTASITNGIGDVGRLAPYVANVATQVLYTSTTEIYDTWHVPEYEGYSDLAYRAVWSNGRWYGFTINAEDGYGDLFISSGAGNANATTVTMSDAYGSVTWNRTGTATNDIPVYDIVGRQYDYMSGMTYVDGPTGDWFDIQTNSWHVWIADRVYYSPFMGTNVRDCRIFETANPTNWTPVTGLIRIPEGAASITGTVTWAYIDASHYTNVQVVLTPRSLNALGLARFSDLDKYAVPRQRLTEEVRRAVNLAADYLWDPLDEVCYRRQMSGGFLDYVAVTNIDVTLPENWQALEALEAERRSQQ